jgi:uncharacterized protein (TIGR00730 family)
MQNSPVTETTSELPNFNIQNIFVCMGSSEGNDDSYRLLARGIGKYIGKRGYGLVYGGGEQGLMGIVSASARKEGASIKAVITEAFKKLEDRLTPETTVVDKLHQRKEKMITLADATIIIPGGVGTIDEMMEVFAVNDMARFEDEDAPIHPLIIINENGFYDYQLLQIIKTVETGFTNIEKCRAVYVVNSATEAMDLIDRFNHTKIITAQSFFRGSKIPDDFPSSFADMVQAHINKKEKDIIIAKAYAAEMGLPFTP